MKLEMHEEYCPNWGNESKLMNLIHLQKHQRMQMDSDLIPQRSSFIPPPGNAKSKDENNPSSIDSHDLRPIYRNRKKMPRYF